MIREIITLCLIGVVSSEQAYKIHKLNPGFIYQRTGSVLISTGHLQYNLKTDLEPLETLVQQLYSLISVVGHCCTHKDCSIILNNMYHKLNKLQLFSRPSTKVKRSFGSWILSLFNLQTIDPLDTINTSIMSNNQKLIDVKLGVLQKEIYSTRNKTHEILQEMTDNVNRTIVALQTKNDISSFKEFYNTFILFNSLVELKLSDLELEINSFEKIYRPSMSILNTLLNEHTDIIQHLQYHTKESLLLSSAYTQIIEGSLITSLIFPIHSAVLYDFLTIIAIPSIRETKLVIPMIENPHIAVNHNFNKYYTFTPEEYINNCEKIKNNLLSCTTTLENTINPMSPCEIRSLYNDSITCAATQILNTPGKSIKYKMLNIIIKKNFNFSTGYYQKSLSQGVFLYAKASPTIVEISCQGSFNEITLFNAGTIHLRDDCQLKDDKLTLFPHKEENFQADLHFKNITLTINNIKTGKNQLITLGSLSHPSTILLDKPNPIFSLELTELIQKPSVVYGGISFLTILIFVAILICFCPISKILETLLIFRRHHNRNITPVQN